MKNIIKLKYSVLLAALLLLVSCETDKFTGDSLLVPTTPTITISGIPASISFVEKDSVFTFTATLSVAQVVDVPIFISQTAGDATEGADFKILNDAGKLAILAGTTTGKVMVQVLADELAEGTETFTITIGDAQTGNATLVPVSVEFTIQNTVSSDLSVDMSWSTDVLDAVGVDMDPEDVFDLRLLIVDAAGEIVDGADGSGFESWGDFAGLDDGVYTIAADIYSTKDFGDLQALVTIDFTLEFNQLGVINAETFTFPAGMTNEFVCDLYRSNLATVTKVGSVYTIVKAFSFWQDPSLADLESLVGTWTGTDGDDTGNGGTPYASEVVTTYSGGKLYITGLGRGWMQDWWGEVIVTETPVVADVNFETGEISIALQPIMTTTWGGDPQAPYSVASGTEGDLTGSTFTMGCDYPSIHLEYDFLQGTKYIAMTYTYYNFWTAELSLDPAGKKAFMHDYKEFLKTRTEVIK